MSTKFFTNREEKSLFKKFKGAIDHMADIYSFHAVVGYFRASGYFPIREHLHKVPEVKILVGINVDQISAESKRRGLLFFGDPDRTREEFIKMMRQDIREAEYIKDVEDGIMQFMEDVIDKKIQIRIHKTKKLHAKIYIFLPKNFNEYSGGEVITGSSNLTDAGLGIKNEGNYEFNVALRDYEDVAFGESEFQQLWDEGEEVLQIDVLRIKDGSHIGQLYKPFEIYIKLLIEYFGKNIESVGTASPFYKTIFNGNGKKARDFIKKMLGRIVFLYFLEKKGWLGVPENEAWGNGDPDFLSKLFKNCKDKSSFYPLVLEPLFYEALNIERTNDLFNIDADIFSEPGYNKLKIPFLNGGLFEQESYSTSNLVIPGPLFNELFKFFDHYNFTVYEDSPDDHTVAVDPEMLGHIFENLLEDNKDKGAFYTPKEIVHYMCQQCLIEYLYSKCKADVENDELHDGIERFIKNQEIGGVANYEECILQSLRDIKVCDPAIGSGAFPMGILLEIFHSVETLHYANEDTTDRVWGLINGWRPADVKLDIIQNSIYGVDIELGAVDIARLRFWLSLVVDDEKPKALPNLDYKIVVGNSLLTKFEDQIIDIDWVPNKKNTTSSTVDRVGKQRKLLTQLFKLQQKYFTAKGTDKVVITADIRNLKCDILINQLEMNLIHFEQNNPLAGGFAPLPKEIQKNNERKFKIIEFKASINRLKSVKSSDEKMRFFDWKLSFPEVLNEEFIDNEVGFDLIIANPPYVGEKGHKEIFRDIKKGFLGKYYNSKMDIFYFFFHLAISQCKDNGCMCFITTNYYPTADGAKKLRKHLKEDAQILSLVNFNEFKVFDSALGQHNLITFLKKTNMHLETDISYVERKNQTGKLILSKILSGNDDCTIYTRSNNIYENENNYIRFNINDSSLSTDIYSIISKDSISLGSIAKINSGCDISISKITNMHIQKFDNLKIELGDGVFVLSQSEVDELSSKLSDYEKKLIKPYIKNSNIDSYIHTLSDSHLIYVRWEENKKQIPNIIKHLNKFKPILEDQVVRYEEPNWPWYSIHRPREIEIFETKNKIIVPYRSIKNHFAFSENSVYSSRDVFYIIPNDSNKTDLFSLLGILNSKLIYKWLYNKGKRKGDTLELYFTPLSEIPIKGENQVLLSNLVKKLVTKKNVKNKEILIKAIDHIVYKIYNLTYQEASLIEGNTDWFTEDEYNKLSIK